MKNKRGAELTIGTIVIIVLAIAVLVFLIFGFTTGWNNLWSKIGIYGGGGSNINDIVQACAASCAQQDDYGFNQKTWDIQDDNNLKKDDVTCEELTGIVQLVKGGSRLNEPSAPVVPIRPIDPGSNADSATIARYDAEIVEYDAKVIVYREELEDYNDAKSDYDDAIKSYQYDTDISITLTSVVEECPNF